MSKENFCYKPESLSPGDKIGLVNPVGEMNKKYAETAVPRVISYLEKRGYRIAERTIRREELIDGIQDPNVLWDYYDPYLSDKQEICLNPYTAKRKSFLALNNPSPRERARLFNEAVASSKAIFPLVGNRFGLDIIDHIDYASFQKHKPIFVTFSAASAFLLHLHLKTNTVVFYGPHIHFLVSSENQYTKASFWHLLEQRGASFVLENIYSSANKGNIPPPERIPFFSYKLDQGSSSAEGTLVPIFLFSLQAALRYGKTDFSPQGKILIVEANERNYEDYFTALEEIHQRVDLSKLTALVLASFIAFKPENASLRKELLNPEHIQNFVTKTRRLLKDNAPVIYGFPMGHSKYKLTVPMGIQAELDLETGNITFKEKLFSKAEAE